MGSAVDEDLARLPKEPGVALEELRQTIRSVVPEVEEVIRTGVPAFRYNGKPLPAPLVAKLVKAHVAEIGGFNQ